MTKEEILEKSRKDNSAGDEREKQIQIGAYRAAYLFCYALIGLFLFTGMFVDLPQWFHLAIMVFFEGSGCAYNGYIAYKKKSRSYMLIAIGWGIFAFLSLILFYRRIL